MQQKLPRRQLAEALLELMQKEPDTAKLAKQIAAYVVTEGRMQELDLLMRDIERLQYERSGQLEVYATSARPLTDSVKRAITDLFPAKDKVMHEEIDKDLIGGVRVRAQDQVLDLSVRTRLRQLKQSVKV